MRPILAVSQPRKKNVQPNFAALKSHYQRRPVVLYLELVFQRETIKVLSDSPAGGTCFEKS